MFGAGRNSCGIIIEPASPLPSSSRPSSPPLPSPYILSRRRQAFLNEIWSQIDLANTHAPSHSRLFPSMILITDPTSKPFARTPKETVLRGRVLEEFKGEIEALYARLDAKDAMAKEGDVDESVEWGEEESVKAFVRSVVESVMTPRVGGVDEEGDLFAQGCDSLQASFIRNKILKALDASFSAGSAGISIRGKVGTNVVFEYPSVGKLSAYLVEVVASTGGYSTGSANGVEHVNGDGHLNGYADGHLNGYADGHLNGYADGHLNGYADGHVNGSTKTNGANGHANGTTNGVNGIKKENAGRETEVERRVRAMRAMLHKYSSNWPPSPPSIPSLSTPHSTASKSVSATTNGVRTKVGEAVGARGGGGAGGGECVLVTGTTGALGTYILSSLILSPRLNMIWALNRPSPSSSPKSLLERQSEAFDERGIGRGVLEDAIKTGKVVLLEGSPSPLSSSSASQWDLPAATFTEIVGSVTSIIHNAWKLDFNQSLSSFESNVAQTRYILDLAHLASTSRSSSRSPAAAAATPNGKTERKNVHVMFTSSISTVSNYTANVNGKGKGRVPEEFINDPSVAVGSGYGESKWVADALLHRIATSSPSPHMKTDGAIKVTSFRIGQLCGSTMNGAWNGSDWVPIILRSCVPPSGAGAGAGESGVVVPVFGEDKRVCWVPVDVAANSIVDSMFVPHTEAGAEGEGGYRTFNIVHPNPTSWNTIFHSFAASLSPPSSPLKAKGIKTVEIGKWVEELKEDAANEEGGEEIMKRRPAIKILSFLEHGIASTSPSSGIPNGPTTTKSNGHVNGNTNDHAIGNGNGHINSSAKPTIDEHEEKEAMGMARLDTSRMESASEAFRGMKKIDERDVEKWVGWWKERGIVGAGASGL
ncbi:hypothetical protein SISSUDRAFT_1041619 [Sistotremastrum suecicum HHB10207 ss-3]|uniref:Polyketide synthase-like phosphopantetheine-binding domain-containing protein n=1 Tax=Sistotremastrum suecicum HHB10207 ss-3 TaxID=1314776 RepID=A0A166H460_9AGAM|nr:hypothetical protein SISSUDRAFT_1041619 [Sistotremastrum suecicum HHB10207 ss-3]